MSQFGPLEALRAKAHSEPGLRTRARRVVSRFADRCRSCACSASLWSKLPPKGSRARTTTIRRAIRLIGDGSKGRFPNSICAGRWREACAREPAAKDCRSRALRVRCVAAARRAGLFPRCLDAARIGAAGRSCRAKRSRARSSAIGPRLRAMPPRPRPMPRGLPSISPCAGATAKHCGWVPSSTTPRKSPIAIISNSQRDRVVFLGRRGARQSAAPALGHDGGRLSSVIPTNGGISPGAINCGRR
jgi:hypothetical protein